MLRISDEPIDVTWNRDGKRLLTRTGYADTENTVEIWDSYTGETITSLHKGVVVSKPKWNRNETRVLLVSEEEDGTIWIVNTLNNEREVILSILPGVQQAEWSPDDRFFLTSSSDKIRVWNSTSGELVSELKLNAFEPMWRPDGNRFLAIDRQGVVNTYLVNIDDLSNTACSRLGRNLTWDEWQQYFPTDPYRQTCPNLPVHYTVPEEAR